MPGHESVVGVIELLPGSLDLALVADFDLRTQAASHRVAHANQSPDALHPMQRQVIQNANMVVLADADLVVDQRVGVGLDVVRGREGLVERWTLDSGALWPEHVAGQQGNRLRQSLHQRHAVAHERRFGARIHAAFEAHLAQHHLRVRGEVFIERNRLAEGVGDFPDGLPRWPGRQFAGQPFAQDHDVGGDFGVGVSLEGVVGQTDRAEQVGLIGDILAKTAIKLVERAFGRDEEDQAAGPNFVQRRGEEVVVDDEAPALESRIEGPVIAKRDIKLVVL